MDSEMNMIREQMIALYEKTKKFSFEKNSYSSKAKATAEEAKDLLTQIAERIEDPEQMDEITAIIPEYVKGQIDQLPTKRKMNAAHFDENMNMVSWYIPIMNEIPSMRASEFTQKMADKWNSLMPEYKIMPGTIDSIQGGFRSRLCYITTATCKAMNCPDDGYELSLLRKYRDEVLALTPEGREIIEAYYDVAPTIVNHIDGRSDSKEIYQNIWEQYLSPCVSYLEKGDHDSCQERYTEMVYQLKDNFFYN